MPGEKLATSDKELARTLAAQREVELQRKRAESQGRTVASIKELDRAGRVQEIGRMLSGEMLTSEALKHAERLIETGLAAN